jgi:hypothetical protein
VCSSELTAILLAASLLSAFLAVLVGAYPVPAAETLAILASAVGCRSPGRQLHGQADRNDIRLSRIVLSWLVGVARPPRRGLSGCCATPWPIPSPSAYPRRGLRASVAIYLGLA